MIRLGQSVHMPSGGLSVTSTPYQMASSMDGLIIILTGDLAQHQTRDSIRAA